MSEKKRENANRSRRFIHSSDKTKQGTIRKRRQHHGGTIRTDQLKKKKLPSTLPTKGSGIPSGFVLKLYQMVNGAPDKVRSIGLI